jgi:hypothetical protein
MLALVAACSARPCKSGTLLVTLDYGALAASADSVRVIVSAPGVADRAASFAYPRAAKGSVEVDFSRYTVGQLVTVRAVASKKGTPVATGSGMVELAAACATLTLHVDGSPAVADMSGDLGSSAPSDLAGLDLAGLDLAGDDLSVIDMAAPPGSDLSTLPDMATPYCQAPSTIACYLFEDSGGSIARDSSPAHNDLMVQVGAAEVVGGYPGKALSPLQMSPACVADNPSFAVSRVTIEAWIRSQSPSGTRENIVEKLGQFSIFTTSNVLACQIGSASPIMVNGAIAANKWQHVACTSDGARILLFVDGHQLANQNAAGQLTQTTDPFCVGDDDPQTGTFKGLIDDVRVLSTALSPQQICMDAGGTGC